MDIPKKLANEFVLQPIYPGVLGQSSIDLAKDLAFIIAYPINNDTVLQLNGAVNECFSIELNKPTYFDSGFKQIDFEIANWLVENKVNVQINSFELVDSSSHDSIAEDPEIIELRFKVYNKGVMHSPPVSNFYFKNEQDKFNECLIFSRLELM